MYGTISLHNKTSISQKNSHFIIIQILFPIQRNWKKLNQNERLDSN